jgi:hypothetical protein
MNGKKEKKNLDSESIIENLKRYFPKYLLTTRDSIAGKELIQNLIAAIKMGKGISLYGDKYFAQLIIQLFNTLNQRAVFETEEGKCDKTLVRVYVPGPEERTEDLPAVISFMVGDILESLGEYADQAPRHICGVTIDFILFYPKWSGFQQIYNFLRKCAAHEWENGTITLYKALNITSDEFADQTPIPEGLLPTTKAEIEFLGGRSIRYVNSNESSIDCLISPRAACKARCRSPLGERFRVE